MSQDLVSPTTPFTTQLLLPGKRQPRARKSFAYCLPVPVPLLCRRLVVVCRSCCFTSSMLLAAVCGCCVVAVVFTLNCSFSATTSSITSVHAYFEVQTLLEGNPQHTGISSMCVLHVTLLLFPPINTFSVCWLFILIAEIYKPCGYKVWYRDDT